MGCGKKGGGKKKYKIKGGSARRPPFLLYSFSDISES
jgi:hypothetical protein